MVWGCVAVDVGLVNVLREHGLDGQERGVGGRHDSRDKRHQHDNAEPVREYVNADDVL